MPSCTGTCGGIGTGTHIGSGAALAVPAGVSEPATRPVLTIAVVSKNLRRLDFKVINVSICFY
jgi:hypothetical protein